MLIQAQGQYKLDSLQKELEQHPSLIEIENGKFTTVELYKEERVSIRENNRHFGEASDRKKEPNVLQLATSVLDNKSHGQHTDSYPQTEKFSLIEAVDRDSKMSQVVDT
ncbi:MAG: hypothetical protein QNJ72_45435 [Pleurocapsa sp. MO_226.B13]|nr:hypothetical protein [Pleurocapsa sp. MO_226.B13]